MHVVAASVIDVDLGSVPLRFDLAGVGQARLFLQGQGVEFGPHQNERSGAVLVDRDNARLVDPLCDLESHLPHQARELGRRACFLIAELRVGVDVLVERVQVWIGLVQHLIDGNARLCGIEGLGGRRGQQGGQNQGFFHGFAFMGFSSGRTS